MRSRFRSSARNITRDEMTGSIGNPGGLDVQGGRSWLMTEAARLCSGARAGHDRYQLGVLVAPFDDQAEDEANVALVVLVFDDAGVEPAGLAGQEQAVDVGVRS